MNCDRVSRTSPPVWSGGASAQQKSTSSLGRLAALVGQERTAGTLRILHECRPYELGWLLYAFAGRESKGIQPSSRC